MHKKIAIPLENGVLCPHFGHCEKFAIIEVADGKISDVQIVDPPEHVPGAYPSWIAGFGVTDVIAGGMGGHAIQLFNEQDINAFIGAPIETPEKLVMDFIDGTMQLSANYCDHSDHHHHHHHHNH